MKKKEPRFKNRILIVDDDPLHIQSLTSKIPSDRYEIITATSGKNALKITADTLTDIIPLDIVMPGLDGFDLIMCRRRFDTV